MKKLRICIYFCLTWCQEWDEIGPVWWELAAIRYICIANNEYRMSGKNFLHPDWTSPLSTHSDRGRAVAESSSWYYRNNIAMIRVVRPTRTRSSSIDMLDGTNKNGKILIENDFQKLCEAIMGFPIA